MQKEIAKRIPTARISRSSLHNVLKIIQEVVFRTWQKLWPKLQSNINKAEATLHFNSHNNNNSNNNNKPNTS